MSKNLVFVSGASSGLGLALVRTLPFDDARTIDISRRGGSGCEHFAADLADQLVLVGQLQQFVLQIRADLVRILLNVLFVDDLQRGEAGCH